MSGATFRSVVARERTMARVVILAGLLLLPVACTPFDHETVRRPPESAEEGAQWWKTTIDDAPLEFLAVFAEAADRHRTRGSSAIYEVYVAVDADQTLSYRLPCPPPPGAEALIRQRIAGYCPPARACCDWSVVSACRCDRCSRDQAMATWHEASRALVDRGSAP